MTIVHPSYQNPPQITRGQETIMISHYLTHLLTGKDGCEDYNSVLGSELNASMYNWHYNKSEITGNQRMTKKKKKTWFHFRIRNINFM